MKYVKYYYLFLFFLSFLFVYMAIVASPKKLHSQIQALRLEVSLEFAEASASVTDIVTGQGLNEYLEFKDVNSRNRFEDSLLELALSRPQYDQIRYINEQGKEVVRVDRNTEMGFPALSTHLQDKSSRYYFLDTMKIHSGEMYISPLDLNVDNGGIEEPLKPTMRLSTPVFDSQGEKAGIVIINYLASSIIDSFYESQKMLTNKELLFINSDGYFFKGHVPEEEWGFMYADRTEKKFPIFYPIAWQKIILKDTGVFFTQEGVFIFDKLFPIEDVQKLHDKTEKKFSYFSHYLSVSDFHMVIVMHATYQQLFREFIPYLLVVLVLFLLPPASFYVQQVVQHPSKEKR